MIVPVPALVGVGRVGAVRAVAVGVLVGVFGLVGVDVIVAVGVPVLVHVAVLVGVRGAVGVGVLVHMAVLVLVGVLVGLVGNVPMGVAVLAPLAAGPASAILAHGWLLGCRLPPAAGPAATARSLAGTPRRSSSGISSKILPQIGRSIPDTE
jgi:hypothetical protein